MSSTYNLEPPPTAKVVLQTTSGEIELELFAKQTPLASRNFLQHCLNGYYDGSVFHRLVPGFVLQGGDPTGFGDGGESIYPNGPFADEIHSRLKFNRRGLLGMANSGRKDDNGSQFFLTLAKTEELTGKNTMFGRVVGDTIYNVIKMGEAELIEGEGSERPLYPTTITGAEILLNPFPDMVKRDTKPKTLTKPTQLANRKKPKKQSGKVLLSFGGEGYEEESSEPAPKKAKFNSRLVAADELPESSEPAEVALEKRSKSAAQKQYRSPSPIQVPRVPAEPKSQLPVPNDEEADSNISSSPENEQVKRVSSMLEKTNAQISELKASMKRITKPAYQDFGRKKSALEEMIPENTMRGRKRKHTGRGTGSSDAQVLKMLDTFRAKLEQAPEEEKTMPSEDKQPNSTVQDADREQSKSDDQEGDLCDLHFISNCQSCKAWDKEGTEEVDLTASNDKGWMSHALKFDKDRLGKDLGWKRKNDDDLIVIDPREKARDIKEERRGKGRDNDKESGRAWDKYVRKDDYKDRDRDRNSYTDRERDRDGHRHGHRHGTSDRDAPEKKRRERGHDGDQRKRASRA